MKTRATVYPYLNRSGEAAGVALLSLPFSDFWPEIESRFVRKVVQYLYRGRKPENMDHLLEQSRLGTDAIMLAEWFVDYDAPHVELTSDSVEGLTELASRAEDLARDDGEWKQDARELDQPADQAIADFRQRLETLSCKACATHGPEAAKVLLEHVRQRISHAVAETRRPHLWTGDRSAELERVARELRALAYSRASWKRAIVKFRPKTTLRLLLSDMERSIVTHQLLPVVQRAAHLRFEHERQARRDHVRNALLGAPGQLGLLDQALARLDRDIQFFRQMAATSTTPQSLDRLTALHEIRLFESLDDVVDRKTGDTLAHVYGRAIKQSGSTAHNLADRIRANGITVGGRRYSIADWPHYLKPADARQAVMREAARYLGSANSRAPINILRPRTAFEHAAGITPMHPALRSRLLSSIPAWIRQSRPFADVDSIVNAEPQVYPFLYCFPPHRRAWQSLLRSKITVANGTDASGVRDAYSTGHPYVVILVQHAFLVPLGALKTLPACTSRGNLLRRTKDHPPLVDRNDYPELRVLRIRPTDYADSAALFHAGRKAKLVLPVPSSSVPKRYALTNVDASLESLFSPELFEPELLTDAAFHKALLDRSFRQFVQLNFPEAHDFHQLADRLAREPDSAAVCAELADRGILNPAAPGHYRLNMETQTNGEVIPESFFHRRQGPLQGLDEGEFTAELHRNDTLYNAFFWRAVDAVELGLLSVNDVPASVASLARFTA